MSHAPRTTLIAAAVGLCLVWCSVSGDFASPKPRFVSSDEPDREPSVPVEPAPPTPVVPTATPFVGPPQPLGGRVVIDCDHVWITRPRTRPTGVEIDPESRGLANAIVYVDLGTLTDPPAPPSPQVLRVTAEGLEPPSFAVRRNQPIRFRNELDEPVYLRWYPVRNREGSIVVPPHATASEDVRFPTTELPAIRIQSVGEPSLRGRAFVTDHRFFAITDDEGRFSIDGLPRGWHRLYVEHAAARFHLNAPAGRLIRIPREERPTGDLELTIRRLDTRHADVVTSEGLREPDDRNVAHDREPGGVAGTIRIRVSRDPRELFDGAELATPRERARARTLLDPRSGFDPTTRGLANVVVYLEERPPGPPRISTRPPHVIHLTDNGRVPGLSIVEVGQPVILSNLTSRLQQRTWRENGILRVLEIPARTIVRTPIRLTERDRDPIDFAAARFGGLGPLLLLDHRYFAVTNSFGQFHIDGLPPGRHRFRVLHPTAHLRSVPLVAHVRSGRTTRLIMEPSEVVFRRPPESDRIATVGATPPFGPGHSVPDSESESEAVASAPRETFPFVGPTLPVPWYPRSHYSELGDLSHEALRNVLNGGTENRRRMATRALFMEHELADVAETLVPLTVDADDRVRIIAAAALWRDDTEDSRRTAALGYALSHGLSERHVEELLDERPGPLFDQLLPAVVERCPHLVLRDGDGRLAVLDRIRRASPRNVIAQRLWFEGHVAAASRSIEPAAFFVDVFHHLDARHEARRLGPGLASVDAAERGAALTAIGTLGPAAADENRAALVAIARSRRIRPEQRAIAVRHLEPLVHDPAVARLFWDVANDWTRTEAERIPALRTLADPTARVNLPVEWQRRVAGRWQRFDDTVEYLRAVAELRRIIADLEDVTRRTRRAQIRHAIDDLEKLRALE